MIDIRSKRVFCVALYLIGSALWYSLVSGSKLPSLEGGGYILEVVNNTGSFVVGVGLLMNRRWAMHGYFLLCALGLFTLIYQHTGGNLPERGRITVYVVLLIVYFVPGFLVWTKRDKLEPVRVGDGNA